ncbi:MAG: deoxyribodipyrimidine photo-lyase [Ignavibacteriaceae bacterium]|nr:deoxyribodipyrimidine photo-lyase [Ignavibacteriaceae bacterium]
MVNSKRVRLLQEGENRKGPVLYWMSRSQRLYDNWSVEFARELASEKNAEFGIVFTLVPEFLEATIRQYGFMLKGLEKIETLCAENNIPFTILPGTPDKVLPGFINEHNVSALVSDFDPLRIKRIWKRDLAKKINVPFYEVDSHNIVPCLHVSQKEEYGAYTLRPKINRLFNDFLDAYPEFTPQKKSKLKFPQVKWEELYKKLKVNMSVKEVDWILPGWDCALDQLEEFINARLAGYDEQRNDPTLDFQSDLSPYFHFGQLSSQTAVMRLKAHNIQDSNTEAFYEQVIVRKELTDNFCYYNTKYDSIEGIQPWAKKTLDEHRRDKREYTYTLKEFEAGKTHEDLWNAAQLQMVKSGKMHNYMRMYWAKKILEWSESPEEALRIAIFLNDKYELDGRDPNGYVGCAWSIGGIHDRAWTERQVFGKIRYMNYNGCKRKFDTDSYIRKWS